MDLRTVEQIKTLLDELDDELPVLSDDERVADRQQIVRLLSDVVGEWKARGYSYAQIAEKLRDKGVIRISEKTLRAAVEGRRRKRRAKPKTSLRSGGGSGGGEAVASSVVLPVLPKVKSETERKVEGRSSGGSSVSKPEPATSSGQFVAREDSDEL